MFTISIVRKNSDVTEGKGSMVPIKYILHEEDAIAYTEAQPDAYGRQREWKGHRYGEYALETVPIHESLAEIDDYEPIDHRAQALAKLTAQEKRALGF